MSKELRNIIRSLLGKSSSVLELFFDHCIYTMLQELDRTPGETRWVQVWGTGCAPLAQRFFCKAGWCQGFLGTGMLLLLVACSKSSSELLPGEGKVGSSSCASCTR